MCNKKKMVSREICLQIRNVDGANVQSVEMNSWISSLGKWNVSVVQNLSCLSTVQAQLKITKQIQREIFHDREILLNECKLRIIQCAPQSRLSRDVLLNESSPWRQRADTKRLHTPFSAHAQSHACDCRTHLCQAGPGGEGETVCVCVCVCSLKCLEEQEGGSQAVPEYSHFLLSSPPGSSSAPRTALLRPGRGTLCASSRACVRVSRLSRSAMQRQR